MDTGQEKRKGIAEPLKVPIPIRREVPAQQPQKVEEPQLVPAKHGD